MKCHQSFCLASHFICDGVKQCQYGEDEQNCGKYISYNMFISVKSMYVLAVKIYLSQQIRKSKFLENIN